MTCGIYPGWKRGELLIAAEHKGCGAAEGDVEDGCRWATGQKSWLLIGASSFAVMSKGQPRRGKHLCW